MIRRKRTVIIIEEQTALEITWHDRGASAWCQECNQEVSFVPTEKAAQILGMRPGEIDLLIHGEVIHGVVSAGGRLSICLKSIISGISSCAEDNKR